MSRIIRKLHVASLLVGMLLLWGCSDRPDLNQPGNESTVTDATASTIENEYLAVEDAGGNLGDAKGIFELGWQELFRPGTDSSMVVGHAMAVGFDSTPVQCNRRPPMGVDMGSVYLNFGGNHVEFLKLTGRNGGTAYVSSPKPRPGVEPGPGIGFISSGTYEFEVTGSSAFPAVTTGLLAPPALLNLEGPADGDSINPADDLVVTWQGGYADAAMVLVVMPALPPMGGPGGGRGPGGGPGHGEGGQRGPGNGEGGPGNIGRDGEDHPGPGMPPPDSTRGIVVRLTTNPGTYTLPAADLRQLIQKSGAKGLRIEVSQLTVNQVDHDGGKIHIVMRDHARNHVRVAP